MFLAKDERCTIHGPDDIIKPYGSCGLFVKGYSMPGHPMGNVTKRESGYEENRPGFSCKRCEYFHGDEKKCEKIDHNSFGDDPGIIHPDACCNAWDSEEKNNMAVLSTKQRKSLPKGEFAVPGKRPGSGSYPIPDASHARNALARVSQHGSPAQKAAVRSKVRSKFPNIAVKAGSKELSS